MLYSGKLFKKGDPFEDGYLSGEGLASIFDQFRTEFTDKGIRDDWNINVYIKGRGFPPSLHYENLIGSMIGCRYHPIKRAIIVDLSLNGYGNILVNQPNRDPKLLATGRILHSRNRRRFLRPWSEVKIIDKAEIDGILIEINTDKPRDSK